MSGFNERRTAVYISLVLIFFTLSLFFSTTRTSFAQFIKKQPEYSFEPPQVQAESVIVYDIDDASIIFSKNATTSYPIASLTKVMTAIQAKKCLMYRRSSSISQSSHASSYSKDTTKSESLYLISSSTPVGSWIDTPIFITYQGQRYNEGDSHIIFGDTWKARDLIRHMLVTSSNTAAYLLAEYCGGKELFVKEMQESLRQMGMFNTHIFDPSGLDTSSQSLTQRTSRYKPYVRTIYKVSESNAFDLSILFSHFYKNHPDLSSDSIRNHNLVNSNWIQNVDVKNTNILLDTVPGIVAGKTGHTNKAGGALGIVYKTTTGRDVVIIVLRSSRESRFGDMYQLIQATEQYYRKNKLFSQF
jgi:D-alanyl-D-alanine carboxypeptidase